MTVSVWRQAVNVCVREPVCPSAADSQPGCSAELQHRRRHTSRSFSLSATKNLSNHFQTSLCCRSTSMTSSFSFTLFRLSRTSSSCVQPGGRPVLGQQQAAKYGCTCSITWRQTPASGQVWLSATSMPATVLSCPFSSTRPRWPTSHCRRRRNCCPIGCCATGARSPTPETRPPGPDRQLSAGISVCLLGLATLTPVDGWSWTWRCVHMHRWGPGTMCVTSGTSWASTSGAVLGCTGDLQVVLGFFYLLLLSVTF